MELSWWGTLLLVVLLTGAGCLGWYIGTNYTIKSDEFYSPFTELSRPKELPLQRFAIPNLKQLPLQSTAFTIQEVLASESDFTAYKVSFVSLGRQMTGQLTVPTRPFQATAQTGTPAILMLRGYVPAAQFQTGVGTRNAAAQLASAGFVTLAPDFFGYGGSDPEPEDTWQARFEKPQIVMELLKSLERHTLTVPVSSKDLSKTKALKLGPVGMWAHSNGGQIALTTLEALEQPIPTTLWAPVTAPFPYSILFFTDENEDEGKAMRKWVALFEKEYDVFDFSLTQHLNRLTGPIQLHHGTADDAALLTWSQEFVDKVAAENKRRATTTQLITEPASTSAEVSTLPAITLTYYEYPGADHNLQPDWNTVVKRDIEFFNEHLK